VLLSPEPRFNKKPGWRLSDDDLMKNDQTYFGIISLNENEGKIKSCDHDFDKSAMLLSDPPQYRCKKCMITRFCHEIERTDRP